MNIQLLAWFLILNNDGKYAILHNLFKRRNIKISYITNYYNQTKFKFNEPVSILLNSPDQAQDNNHFLYRVWHQPETWKWARLSGALIALASASRTYSRARTHTRSVQAISEPILIVLLTLNYRSYCNLISKWIQF